MEVFGYTPIRGIYENTEAGISVQEAQENATGLLVVLKLINCRDVIDINVILEEAMTQKGLDHPCICKVLKAGIFSSGTFIVLEKLEKDLAKELKERGPDQRFYSEWEIFEFLKQIVGALAYAQEKLCDFGNAKELSQFGDSSHTFLGTPLYLSPQLREEMANKARMRTYRKVEYNPFKSDIYSLGLTVLFMASLTPPNVLATLEDLPEKTFQVIGNLNYSNNIKNCLWWMLSVREEERPDFIALRNYLASLGLPEATVSQQPAAGAAIYYQSVPVPRDAQIVSQTGMDRNRPVIEGEGMKKQSLPIASKSNIYAPGARAYGPPGNPVPASNLRSAGISRDYNSTNSGAPLTNLTQSQALSSAYQPMKQEAPRKCDWCNILPATNVQVQQCGHRFCSQMCYDQAIRASRCTACRAVIP